MPPRFSILIPARNEEKHLPGCLASIEAAAAPFAGQVEIIVALNRCTDRTEQIARDHGAKIVHDDGRNLARIRNTAAHEATGDILVTIDADSRMSPNMLLEIDRLLQTGRYVGGGVLVWPERLSLGIVITGVLIYLMMLRDRVGAGLFWCRREDFEAIGGFNERWVCVEDLDFAKRLRAHGRAKGQRFTTIAKAHIITSCRKFDIFGDWYLLKNPGFVRRLMSGRSQKDANTYYYDVER
jgi:glycosyltransferase involved in cell wall biosynthesis